MPEGLFGFDSGHHSPAPPEPESTKRPKPALIHSEEDYISARAHADNDVADLQKRTIHTLILFEVIMLLLFLLFNIITASVNGFLPLADYSWLLILNALYLIQLYDPIQEKERNLHYEAETDWDTKIAKLQTRIKYEKFRRRIAIGIGVAFCAVFLACIYGVNIYMYFVDNPAAAML